MSPRPLSTFDQLPYPAVQRPSTIPPGAISDKARLTPAEEAWSARQGYLESNGFILRPRLRHGWKPSWLGTGDDPCPSKYEDSIRTTEFGIVDATRASDGAQVVLKAVGSRSEASLGQRSELEILKRLHSPPFAGHVCNHAVPLLGSILMPDADKGSFAVLPLLRMHDDPSFSNVGEAAEFMKQVLRGLAFMHAQNVAHRDIRPSNIMMDGRLLYNEPFHPVVQSLSLDAKTILRPRSRQELDSRQDYDGESPIRYYFTNFSRASHLPPTTTSDGQTKPRLLGSNKGQLGRFPEAMLTVGHDPFKADVYCMGKYVIDDLISQHPALIPFLSLARYMTRRDPRTRPTAADALAHFETIHKLLEPKYLKIPLDPKGHQTRRLPDRSPRRTVSAVHISTHTPYSHGNWRSIDSAHTLVARNPRPEREALKRDEPVTQIMAKGSEPENTSPERKKGKSKWHVFCAVMKSIVR